MVTTSLLLLVLLPVTWGDTDLSDDPAMSVRIASVKQIEDDAAYLLECVNEPSAATIKSRIESVFSLLDRVGHWDRERPAYLLHYIPRNPDSWTFPRKLLSVVVVAPIVEISTLQEAASPGIYRLPKFIQEASGRTIYARPIKDWVYLSPHEELLQKQLPDPSQLETEQPERYDASVTLHLSTLTDPWKQFVEKMSQDAWTKASADYVTTKASEQVKAFFDLLQQNLHRLLNDGLDLTIGVQVPSQTRGFKMDILLRAKENTKLAESLQAIGGYTSKFGGLCQADDALQFAFTWYLNDEMQRILSTCDPAIHVPSFNNLNSTVQYAVKPDLEELMEIAKIVMRTTAKVGRIDVVLTSVEEPDRTMTTTWECYLAGARHLRRPLTQLAQHLRDLGETEYLNMDVVSHGDKSIHRYLGDAYFVLDDNALALSRGRQATKQLGRILDGGQSTDRLPPIWMKGQGRLLRLLLGYIEATFNLGTSIHRYFHFDGHFTFAVDSAPGGARLSLEVDEELLRSMAGKKTAPASEQDERSP